MAAVAVTPADTNCFRSSFLSATTTALPHQHRYDRSTTRHQAWRSPKIRELPRAQFPCARRSTLFDFREPHDTVSTYY